jgi:prepilin-type N-terminal cleavage/methylation domain-containing protein
VKNLSFRGLECLNVVQVGGLKMLFQQPAQVLMHMKQLRNNAGFTLVEVIAVLVIIGILAAAVLPRMSSTSQFDLTANADVIKNQLFSAQGMAMKQGIVGGIKCDGSSYWLFKTNSPDDAANQLLFPGEDAIKVSLNNKKITLTAFTLFFDFAGRPYTDYTDSIVNTPVDADNQLAITVGVSSAPATATITITPETGFIQ